MLSERPFFSAIVFLFRLYLNPIEPNGLCAACDCNAIAPPTEAELCVGAAHVLRGRLMQSGNLRRRYLNGRGMRYLPRLGTSTWLSREFLEHNEFDSDHPWSSRFARRRQSAPASKIAFL